VFRILALLVVLFAAACSRDSTSTPEAPAPAAGSATESQAPIKPLPAQLPDVLARVNGETVTRKELEEYVQNLEGRAGGPVPADQRDRIYRDVLDQLVGYKLLLQEATARKVVVPETEVDARIDQVRKQFPSEDLFMQTLIDRKMTVEQIKADARKEIAIGRLIDSAIADKVAVKPEQVEAFYKTKAEKVLKDVKAGKDFAALAKQHSQDPGSAVNGGDLGFFQQGQMVGPFNDVAFSLKPGTTSNLVETQFGYHIIKVAEKQQGRTVPLEEVRPQLEQYLQNQNKESETEAFVKSLRAKGKVEILV
jgi:peptidyl-prolyl cis-trans isomerase C